MKRDFTFIDDLADAVCRLVEVPPVRPETRDAIPDHDSLSPVAPWRVVNIGNNQPVELGVFIAAIEQALGLKASATCMPMQPGDVPATWAKTGLLESLIGSVPATPVEEGVARFVAWYRDYYQTRLTGAVAPAVWFRLALRLQIAGLYAHNGKGVRLRQPRCAVRGRTRHDHLSETRQAGRPNAPTMTPRCAPASKRRSRTSKRAAMRRCASCPKSSTATRRSAFACPRMTSPR
jgi:hypothetical protein